MNKKPLKLFSASAGAGKTYTLTINYLTLALSEVDPKGYFRKILAVTFTNKAAEEMKKRIVEFLFSISQNKFFEKTDVKKYEKSEEIITKILSELNNDKISKDELINRANQTLHQMLQDYGLFSVMTIDAFVQKLSQSFIEELNLPDQFEVVLDNKKLLTDLIDEILDKINQYPDSSLKQAFIDFSMKEVEDDKSWNNLRESLQKFLLILFTEDYMAIEKELASFSTEDFIHIEKQIIAFEKLALKYLQDLTNSIIELIHSNGLNAEDFVRGKTGPVNDIFKYFENPQLEAKPYSYMKTAIDTETWYSKSASAAIKTSIDTISTELNQFVSEFYNSYQLHSQKFILLNLIKRNLRKYNLLTFIQKDLNEFQLVKGLVSISEFSKKINQIVAADPIPFIYEKLGERYRHIFIDEFQDTSILQWKNFMPLLDNAISSNKNSLIVGDAKQSIYKFRGGEVSLIAALNDANLALVENRIGDNEFDLERFENIINYVESENLPNNFRSSKEIVKFNNNFYEWIKENTFLSQTFPLIANVYNNQLKQNASSPIEGCSSIESSFYLKPKNSRGRSQEEWNWHFQNVFETIQISKSKGFKNKDIAILTRGNKEANFLALQLTQLNDPTITITSADSLLLHFSPAIRFVISFLKFLQESKLPLNSYTVLANYHILIGSTEFNFDKKDSLQNQFLALNFDISNCMQTIDSKAVIIQLIDTFKLLSYKSEIPYLLKLLDLIDEYQLNYSNSIEAFVSYYDQNIDKFSINPSDDSDAITISTIHKSKGLEYSVVIMAFADWDFNLTDSPKWFDFNQVSGFDELEVSNKFLGNHYLAGNSKALVEFDYLKEQYESEKELNALDSLNMLYVATTRAKYDLYTFSTWVSTDELENVATLLYNFSKKEYKSFNEYENSVQYILNDSKSTNEFKDTFKKKENFQIQLERNLEKRPLLRQKESKEDFFSQSLEKRKFGNYIHQLLSNLESDAIKDKLHKLPEEIFEANESAIDGVLNLLENQDYLTLVTEFNTFINEQEIIKDDGTIIRPDRIFKKGNQFVIVDYKTGKSKESHRDQILNYQSLMKEMGYIDVKCKLIYFEESTIVDV